MSLYVAFTIYFRLGDFPAKVEGLLLFGEFLLRSFRAHKSVTNTLSSVRTFHLIHGFNDGAFSHFHLTMFKRALPLTVRHAPSQSPPLPLPVLKVLCEWALGQGDAGVVFAALMSILFFAMARLSSLVPPSSGPYDVTRFPTLADLRWEGDTV